MPHYSAVISPVAQFVKTVDVNHLGVGAVCHFEIEIPSDCDRVVAIFALAHGMDAAITAMSQFFNWSPPIYVPAFPDEFWQPNAGKLAFRWARPNGVFLAIPVDMEMASKDDSLPFFVEGLLYNHNMACTDYQLETPIFFGDMNDWHEVDIPCDVTRLFANYANETTSGVLENHKLSVYVRYIRKQ